MKGTVGIVAFAFGVPETILSNQHIAQISSRKARELEAPVYTQLDVRVEQGIEVEYTDEQLGNPPATLRIARGAIQWAKRRGFRDLWIVAAKPHLSRCLRDLTYAVREAGVQIKIHACKEIEQCPPDEWFCPNSTQVRTQSRKNWQNRERILKFMPMFFYKRVAS